MLIGVKIGWEEARSEKNQDVALDHEIINY